MIDLSQKQPKINPFSGNQAKQILVNGAADSFLTDDER